MDLSPKEIDRIGKEGDQNGDWSEREGKGQMIIEPKERRRLSVEHMNG